MQPFIYDSPEGLGSDLSRTQNLSNYIASHVRVLGDLRAKVMRNSKDKARWVKSNEGGGVLKRHLRARSQAVVTELAVRTRELDTTAPLPNTSGASALAPITQRAHAPS